VIDQPVSGFMRFPIPPVSPGFNFKGDGCRSVLMNS